MLLWVSGMLTTLFILPTMPTWLRAVALVGAITCAVINFKLRDKR